MIDTTKSGDASLVYSTYLGGAGDDSGYGVAFDVSGRAVVTGYTKSADYPTVDSLSGDPGDNDYDVFVSRLDTMKSGNASLLFSTYLGGSGDDEGFGVTTDARCIGSSTLVLTVGPKGSGGSGGCPLSR